MTDKPIFKQLLDDASAPREFTGADALDTFIGQLENVMAECRARGINPETFPAYASVMMGLPFIHNLHGELLRLTGKPA